MVADSVRLAFQQMRMLVTQALEQGIQSEVLGQFLLRSLDNMKLFVMCCTFTASIYLYYADAYSSRVTVGDAPLRCLRRAQAWPCPTPTR